MSGQHVLRVLNFRSLLEHCLVEKFTDATLSQRDFYSDVQIWANLDAALTFWKQWLVDEKYTCTYQLHKQQLARKKLEDEYIRLTAPDHSLGKYNISTKNFERSHLAQLSSKWGYLFVRASRLSWTRKWFFIHSGYFGSCQVETTSKRRGSISIESRVSVLDCELVTLVDTDRRFCFEISVPKLQTSYVLQAETEDNLQEWIRIFSKNKSDYSFGSGPKRSPSLRIKSKANPTTGLSSPTATTTTEIEGPSIVMVSTTPDTEISLDTTSSLTPLLVWEAARAGLSAAKKMPLISWGIPWSLVPTMINLTQDASQTHEKSATTPPTFPRVIWPPSPAWVDIPKVQMPGYTDKLNSQNRELRRLFTGVKTEEVVLDVFVGCLRKMPTGSEAPNMKEIELSKSSLHSPDAELYEVELVKQLKQTGLTPPTRHGYAYSGRGFITQDTFWFYSCVLMTCINTVAIRLKDIEEIRVMKDTSLKPANHESFPANSDLVLSISLVSSTENDIQEPIIIGTIMDDIDMVAEKLRVAVMDAKNNESMSLSTLYGKMVNLSSNLSSHKSVVLDIPLTFNSALQPVAASAKPENIYPNRPHANTVGSQDKANTSGILRTNRQRGDSEPIKSTVIVEQKKRAVIEPPVDPDTPPSHIHVPQGPVECNCDDHLEKMDAQITLPISAKRCYELLFSNEQTAPPTNGGVWEQKTAAIDGHDLTVTKWEMLDGQMQRTLKYWMPVSNPIVRMKEAEVVETQILINKEDYIRYTVQISTKTAALPYADAFIPCVRYCITWVNKSECQLTCYLGVKWVKSVFVRAIVTRAALKGMADSVGVFIPILKSSADTTKATLNSARRKALHQYENLTDDTKSHKSFATLEDATDHLQYNMTSTGKPLQNHAFGARLNKSLSRSVYLRDLDEGFLKNSILPPYSQSQSYTLFLKSKQDETNGVEQVNDIMNRDWYHVEHYRLAIDLDISRERIAMLRHDMLIIFQVLNKVDSQLVENEYMNWLLDTRLKCKYNPPLDSDDPRAEKSISLCHDIRKQLDRLF
ncbi:uncharacterized protein EV154DRAFT_419104 [Mucor mucedo]|uniref:uncharacterized protein n=1 Tax=Mucor mucedo TaxID=29922 RepID=UPI00221EC2B9|nr:uncharacterized protein EV154DRAFT_419104 [Mucor mucedo]KAI7892149.1 hypothetical protein EV154DRAFT_419104 [Mucor mucedo]